jgi:hypothetical protein
MSEIKANRMAQEVKGYLPDYNPEGQLINFEVLRREAFIIHH